MAVKIRGRYNDRGYVREAVFFDQTIVDGKPVVPESISMTKQADKKEADINFIVAKAKRTGFLVDPSLAVTRKAIFGDFSSVPDFLSTQNRLAVYRSEFERLPAAIREKFGNEPSRLVEFMADEANDAEAIELGLKPKPRPAAVAPVPAPAPAPVVPVPAP